MEVLWLQFILPLLILAVCLWIIIALAVLFISIGLLAKPMLKVIPPNMVMPMLWYIVRASVAWPIHVINVILYNKEPVLPGAIDVALMEDDIIDAETKEL